MTWTWRLETEDGSPASEGQSQEFPTQADAETWIGESWRGLVDDGVDQVTLFEHDHVVYGPMSLHPE